MEVDTWSFVARNRFDHYDRAIVYSLFDLLPPPQLRKLVFYGSHFDKWQLWPPGKAVASLIPSKILRYIQKLKVPHQEGQRITEFKQSHAPSKASTRVTCSPETSESPN